MKRRRLVDPYRHLFPSSLRRIHSTSRQYGRGRGSGTAELADHLNADRFYVAGWSGGGPTALACASLFPNRVRSCITIASPGPAAEMGDAWLASYPSQLQNQRRPLLTKTREQLAPDYEKDATVLAKLSAAGLAEWPGTSLSDIAALHEYPAAAESLARSMRLGVSNGIWAWLDDQVAFTRPWPFLVGTIDVPTMIRHGDQDHIVPFKQGQWLADHLPNGRLQKIAGGLAHVGSHTLRAGGGGADSSGSYDRHQIPTKQAHRGTGLDPATMAAAHLLAGLSTYT